MKLKKCLPALLLALFLALSPLMLAVPVNANSDVLQDVSRPVGYEFFGSVLPYVYDDYNKEFVATGNIVIISSLDGRVYVDMFSRSPGALGFSSSGSFYSLSVSGINQPFYRYRCNRPSDSAYSVSWSPFSRTAMTASFSISSDVPFVVFNVPDSLLPSDTSLFVSGTVSLGSLGGPGILSVFSGVSSWLAGAVNNMIPMFWTAEAGLTPIGVLTVCSLALAVILLLFWLIAGWLKFK